MENALVLGTFDGVHIGHRAVIDAAKGFNIIAVTFEYPPKNNGKEKSLITLPEKRYEILKECGVNEIKVLDFSKVKDISPVKFLENLNEKYAPKLISCGFNYRFGKNASGDSKLLLDFCEKNGIALKVAKKVESDGCPVSSTEIRHLISQGEIEKANNMLSYKFSFCEKVVNGDHRGRTLGFPTVNQVYPDDLVKPKFGVYATCVEVDGMLYKGISNIGIRPTFKTDTVMSETYIKNFSLNIYGKAVTIYLEKFIREEKKFENAEQLKTAISNDIKYI